ncbi:serum response factor homolog isoform X2 [Thrips palmi]|uniref:Serum response factor homolog n=1 Tax=Thrips palmi TaxID=161013 RepID=A0A6P9A4X2_THRPL|nr:serum response factor homolog isoform X2 [Thrips palmi]
MDTSAGAGRDARFNLGYNSMSLLGGDTSPDMYGSGRSSATSLSSHSPSGMSRSGMGGLSGSCAPGGGGLSRGLKRSSSDVCFLDQDVTGRPLDCGSDLMDDGFSPAPQKSGPPPNGKKTKGRVKIKMEYIDNKLRRYTTFSKRKTGIMKKAYELSTLTGTQVMLLVASETGHVYTFATRKLQPMITSEAGKALIQTCLNSPDPCPSSGGSSGNGGSDQRMSATGFEETELSYNIGDDEQKESDDALPSPRSVDDGDLSGGESSGQESPRALSPEPQAPPAKFSPTCSAQVSEKLFSKEAVEECWNLRMPLKLISRHPLQPHQLWLRLHPQ